jgi:hypothetical protein
MKRSTNRILTTHTGSLPRPEDLIKMMYAREEGVPVDAAALAARIRSAVAEVLKKQAGTITIPATRSICSPLRMRCGTSTRRS